MTTLVYFAIFTYVEKKTRGLKMAEENKEKPILGEMIANFPVEELKKAILHIDRFDEVVVTEEKTKSSEVEEKMQAVSQKIIEDNL